MAKPYIVYASRTINLSGHVVVYADSLEEAHDIQADYLSEDFVWDETDSVFNVIEITELDEATMLPAEDGESEYYG